MDGRRVGWDVEVECWERCLFRAKRLEASPRITSQLRTRWSQMTSSANTFVF